MIKDILVEQQARINFYALLSRLIMSETDTELLQTIDSDENMLSFFPNYKVWELRETLTHDKLINEHLNVDYTALFLLHLIPYESFYSREDQMMETGGENPVQVIYNQYDFRVELDKARVLSSDHLAVELEFMYKLCEAQMKAFQEDDLDGAAQIAKIEHSFLKEHIIPWAPMFLFNVKSECNTPFYFDVADVTLEFILTDFQALDDFISDGAIYKL
ncbi:MAG TPA: dehydrogenase [Helicobacteraceae bacterium]|nr:dehydrogenase [Helicobacteraceae bacterium]